MQTSTTLMMNIASSLKMMITVQKILKILPLKMK